LMCDMNSLFYVVPLLMASPKGSMADRSSVVQDWFVVTKSITVGTRPAGPRLLYRSRCAHCSVRCVPDARGTSEPALRTIDFAKSASLNAG